MANFGTPFVIGTLTSNINTISYTVPITTINGTPVTGDGFAVYVASSSISSGGPPVAQITDTKGNQYFEVNSSSVTQQISEWRSPTGIALTSSDTLTVTFASSTGTLKDICIVDLPGVATGGLDQVVSNSGSGNPATITASATPVYGSELCMFASANANGGGSPTNLATSGFTVLTTLHSGSSEYLQVGYQIISTAATVTPSSNILGTTNNWAALLTTSLAGPLLQPIQQPFSPQLPDQLVYNPSLFGLRVQSGQGTLAVTQPVNFPGSPSNTITGVSQNFLLTISPDAPQASTFEGGSNGWTNLTSDTIASPTGIAHSGSKCLSITATASGTRNVASCTAGNLPTLGLPVNVGDIVFTGCWFQAATIGRACQVGIAFFDINTNQIGSATFGNTVNDAVNTWQFANFETTAPVGAAYARMLAQVVSMNNGEVHYIDDAILSNLNTNTLPNQVTIYQQNFQPFPLAPAGIPFPLSLNPALQSLRRQVPTANAFGALAGSTAINTVVAYPGAVSVVQNYQKQFPFSPVLQSFMQFNPAFISTRPQNNTGNVPTYIDGGTASSVIAFNNFPDNSVAVFVPSATQNIAVTAPTPPTVVTGVTANVAIGTSGNEVVIVVDINPPDISVAAISGSVSISRPGVVSNVSVAAIAGVVNLGPEGNTAPVTVSAISGSILVKSIGTAATIAVASQGIVNITPQGNAGNVSVAAVAGTIKEFIIGSTGTVTVASSGIATSSVSGVASSITVHANAGTIVLSQSILGVTANVSVATSGIPNIAVPGVVTSISVAAIAGNSPVSVSGVTAQVHVSANPGQGGKITISGFLVDPDFAAEILLSDAGKLLDIPISNMLVSADDPQKQSQGI